MCRTERTLVLLEMLKATRMGMTIHAMLCQLEDRGYEVCKRTVERDLDLLTGKYPIVCDDNSPKKWRFTLV